MIDTERLVQLVQEQHGIRYDMKPWKVWQLYELKPKSFDCSSLVMWSYFMLGFKLPRTSAWQFTYCSKFTGDRQPGDLCFFATGGKLDRINHVAMYVGAGMCIEAVGGRRRKVVRSWADKLEKKSTFVGWRRVPLDRAHEEFFKWVAEHPKPATKENGQEIVL